MKIYSLVRSLMRDLTPLLAALAVGWWAHTPSHPVRAAEGNDFPFFQFSTVAGEGTLTLYSPNDRSLYVYSGVLTGSSSKNCTYAIKLGRAGAPLERTNCQIGSLLAPR